MGEGMSDTIPGPGTPDSAEDGWRTLSVSVDAMRPDTPPMVVLGTVNATNDSYAVMREYASELLELALQSSTAPPTVQSIVSHWQKSVEAAALLAD